MRSRLDLLVLFMQIDLQIDPATAVATSPAACSRGSALTHAGWFLSSHDSRSSKSPSCLSLSSGWFLQNVLRSSLRSQSHASPPAIASAVTCLPGLSVFRMLIVASIFPFHPTYLQTCLRSKRQQNSSRDFAAAFSSKGVAHTAAEMRLAPLVLALAAAPAVLASPGSCAARTDHPRADLRTRCTL